MQDYSSVLVNIRGTVLRCLDETDYDSLDTSISTEGESTTPTPSPGLPMSYQEFESMLVDLIESQRWGAVITHVKQFLQLSGSGALMTNSPNVGAAAIVGGTAGVPSEGNADDIPTLITKIYSQRLTRDRTDIYILSKSETEITENYSLLMENLLQVSSALTELEMMNKSGGSGGLMGGGGAPSGGGGLPVMGIQQPGSALQPVPGGVTMTVTTPELSPSAVGVMQSSVTSSVASGGSGSGGGGGGLRDTVDIITTL